MYEDRDVFLIGGDNDEQATFSLEEVDRQCRLLCSFRGKRIEAISGDFFGALCEIREELGKEGLIPFCYGASLNVYPSGMARQMGLGLQAYKFQMGRQAFSSDLVDVFAEGPDVIPVSVENQREHFKEWVASLKH